MKSFAKWILLLSFVLSFQVNGQTPLSQDQVDAIASHFYKDLNSPERKLRDSTIFKDGARGTNQYEPVGQEVEPRAPFTDLADQRMYGAYCSALTIVVAKAVGEKSYIDSEKTMIFTVYAFEIEEILKSGGNLTPGEMLHLTRKGGEVDDGGQALRYHLEGNKNYEPGQSYVLFVYPGDAAAPTVYHGPDYSTISFDQDTLYFSSQSPLSPIDNPKSESLAHFQARLVRASTVRACPARQLPP
jgi:hypothetical protein